MATKHITITLSEAQLKQAEALAREQDLPVPTWASQLVGHLLEIQSSVVAIRELEAEFGPLTDEDLAAAADDAMES